jgi:hypothetical protein
MQIKCGSGSGGSSSRRHNETETETERQRVRIPLDLRSMCPSESCCFGNWGGVGVYVCALWLRGRGHRGSLAKSRAGSGLLLPAEQSMLAIPRLHSREKTPRGDFAKRFFLHEFSLHLSEPVLGKCCFLQRQLWKRGAVSHLNATPPWRSDVQVEQVVEGV